MADLTNVQAAIASLVASVEAETSVNASIIAVVEGQTAIIAGLRVQLAEAIAAGGDPAALQAIVDALSALEAANTSKSAALAAAVVANTPAA